MNNKSESPNKEEADGSKNKVPLSISTEPEIKEWVEKQAAADERSVSIYLTRLIRKVMKSEQVNQNAQ